MQSMSGAPMPVASYSARTEPSATDSSPSAKSQPLLSCEASTLMARRMPSSRALRSLTMIAAAAPSPIGEHIGSVSGHETSRAASTSATVITSRYCAFGFRLPCTEFLADTIANCSRVVP